MRNKGNTKTAKTSTEFIPFVDDPAYLAYLRDETARNTNTRTATRQRSAT